MNNNNVEIVILNICQAFDEMRIPTKMGIDICHLGINPECKLSVEESDSEMRPKFIQMAASMRQMFLDGTDGITDEEVTAGFTTLVLQAEDYLVNGPNKAQQSVIDILKANKEKADDQANSTLH